MAYIIPSKNIYEIDNPKVIKNAIKSVATQEYKVERKDYDKEVVYSYNDWNYEGHAIDQVFNLQENNSRTLETPRYNTYWSKYIGYFGYTFVDNQKVHNVSIKIPVVRDSSYIDGLYLGTYTEGEGDYTEEFNNISTTFIGTKTYGKANAVFGATIREQSYGEDYFDVSVMENNIAYIDEQRQQRASYAIPKKIQKTYVVEYPEYNPSLQPHTIKNTLSVINVGNIPTATATYVKNDTEEYYQLDLSVFTSFRQTSMAGYYLDIGYGDAQPPTGVMSKGSFVMTGDWEQYEVTELQVSIAGKTIGVEFNEKELEFGDKKKPHSLTANELFQNTSKTHANNTTEYVVNNVLTQYANGKETATVLCVIGEYYNENGALVVSTKNNELPMTFNIGDIVVPMVRGTDGNDYPMSRKSDGSAKQFIVVGTKKYFDGAVWQELTLQEY